MEWLQDKKNQPIVIGVVALILVAAGFVIYTTTFSGSGNMDSMAVETGDPDMQQPVSLDTSAPTPPPDSGVVPGPTGTEPAASAPGGAQTASAIGPMESYRDDPFKPIGWKKPAVPVRQIPHIADLPIPRLPRWAPEEDVKRPAPEPPQPTRRMSGLLLNGRVFAIIETNGRTEIVQPGDRLSDGMAVVDTIERDKVILKTTSATPRYLVVRMAAAPRTSTSAAGAPDTMSPGVPPGYPSQPTPRGPVGMPVAPGGLPRGM